MPAGLVKFGLAGKDLWHRLDRLRAGLETGSGLVLVRRELVARSKTRRIFPALSHRLDSRRCAAVDWLSAERQSDSIIFHNCHFTIFFNIQQVVPALRKSSRATLPRILA